MPRDQQTRDSKKEEPDPPPADEARRVLEDYVNGLRKILETLRRKFN